MGFNVHKSYKTFLRFIWNAKRFKYSSIEYCPSCDEKNIFVYSTELNSLLSKTIATWKSSSSFKDALLKRENYLCIYCLANFRMRSLADAVLKLLTIDKTGGLVERLISDANFSIYETAAYSVFRLGSIKKMNNYMVSEYFDDMPFGSRVNGIRNENLECLTFPDNSFDILINSEVLEHVSDLNKALSEVKRVLKPGGFHVFTIPVDIELPKTIERAKIVDGNVEHLLEPVIHGDSIRGEGILAFRDFGSDVLDFMSRGGFECKEFKYIKRGQLITSVYYAQKAC
jgi:SAM-dependent methyltransferase